MDIEEVKFLIRRKQREALETAQIKFQDNAEWQSYFNGVRHGLTEALEIIGMLDKPNKVKEEPR